MESQPPVGTEGIQDNIQRAEIRALRAYVPNSQAALSVPTNIAEGSVKQGTREFRRYLDISLGSLSELSYLLRFAKDFGFLEEDEYRELDNLRNRAGTLTWRLYVCMDQR